MAKVTFLRHSVYYVMKPDGKELVLFHANICLSVGLTESDQQGAKKSNQKSMYSFYVRISRYSIAFSNVSVTIKVEIAFTGESNHGNISLFRISIGRKATKHITLL